MPDTPHDLLFPATDAGVLVQIVIIALLAIAGLYAARRQPDVRILVIGVWLAAYAGIGVRALH